ncbi:2,3,4,5-tetrahydropyridine-2,6-dicarboxylate N-succinyltransferase [Pseudobacteriovorax antillogorgiicola]|uniref:2,3,4,5-tetrahydropyridine-2-carboxylate N-succinyltransferase n=1 Tax=Pseudobacteriovorax antillogorgiicola TaxID=1513793 RepID=A0A1Y6C552_9BACT|nr:2,3,4,5-tetrahydropyridine-2,6-dicarboxylate N-succinyltransferase [Pseudobacteriovorax antillogorgiicola]TCS49464.1 2,3,4,5-tetrahydropyridine-2-carboxylate N-succinyltransferase [Pseudobacteriovorax antillogorgiicola]SMF46310.1 2,3,4,5-tetrahydropyridine-2-carboxylate N-succinyltransferase [Pseudobacteriovorax antillogorgiicola]
MEISTVQAKIEDAVAALEGGQQDALSQVEPYVHEAIKLLDTGAIRVATRDGDEWTTHAWIKQAILLYFKITKMEKIEVGPFTYFDKIPLKTNFEDLKVRVVPPATARYGTFMEEGVVLMPSYVNIGAYIGKGSMVDTWATVGSCAQIGANVHLSGGVGIGGVLEPAGAKPVIIGDGAFIGSRAIVVEGVEIGNEAVLAANVTITSSTPIIDIRGGEIKESKGRIPARSVVVPGTKEKEVPGGKIYTSCAYIIGDRKPSTDLKTSLNDVLREFALSV